VDDSLARLFDTWLAAAVARVSPPLTFPEIRKAVQAVSALYVERRASGGLGARTSESEGKRAALATYYAPLHFLTALRAAGEMPERARAAVRRVHDLGCGTGVVGAAFARACPGAVEIEGIDRSGWALREARFTYAAFGLRGRTRRASVPESLPRLRPGDAVVMGWTANELEQPARARLFDFVTEAASAGHPLLCLEPLARAVAPWWPTWAAALRPHGVRDLELKFAAELPEWIARLDASSGLDHSTLGARVLVAP
jgi:hypothetical protein